jgi:hypothetical protein
MRPWQQKSRQDSSVDNSSRAAAARPTFIGSRSPVARYHEDAALLRLQRASDMADGMLTQKTSTLRHDDVGGAPLYVAGYGARAYVVAPGTRRRARPTPAQARSCPGCALIAVEMTSEEATERLDVLLEPELLCRDEDMARLKPYTEFTPAHSIPWAIAKGLRWCNEDALRVCILRQLRAAGQCLLYFVYAALSPLHDRTAAEIHRIVRARSGCADVQLAHVETALAELQTRQLASTLERGPTPYTPPASAAARGLPRDYDVNLGRSVHIALGRCFSLAPGTRLAFGELRDGDDVRAFIRRSANSTRLGLVASQLDLQRARRAEETPASDAPMGVSVRLEDVPLVARSQATDAPRRSQDLNIARPVFEAMVVADILRVYGLGRGTPPPSHADAKAVAAPSKPDTTTALVIPSPDDARVRAIPLHRIERRVHSDPHGGPLATLVEDSPRSSGYSSAASDSEDGTSDVESTASAVLPWEIHAGGPVGRSSPWDLAMAQALLWRSDGVSSQ